MKAKKRIAVFVAALALASVVAVSSVAFTGCGADVTLTGSTSVQPLMEKLAEAFEEKTGIVVSVGGGGSSVGVSDAQSGTVDFGMASRDLKSDETGVTATKIAIDGVAIVVKEGVELESVTSEQLYNLFVNGTAIGSITKGAGREAGSGTRDAFDTLVKDSSGKSIDDNEAAYFGRKITTENGSTGAVITAVTADTATIGYISYGSLDENVLTAVPYQAYGEDSAVAISLETIKDGSYKLQRNFNLILPEGGVDALSEDAKAFYDYILSAEGQKIVSDEGYVSISD